MKALEMCMSEPFRNYSNNKVKGQAMEVFSLDGVHVQPEDEPDLDKMDQRVQNLFGSNTSTTRISTQNRDSP